ncbi:MAG: 1-deoxy-D-xylulose-5-phosphate reductoisomerase, partial [Clostridia bacterium]|nr:1-deoxy-D-xylulose-5-phosphate reductoisomerase [Clostridia bacterium]
VISEYPDEFKVVSLAAGRDASLLGEQIRAFRPEVAALADPENAGAIKELPPETSLYTGENAVFHAVTDDCDIVVAAISGFAGLKPVLYAIERGKDVALANKETLVAGGELVMKKVNEKGVRLIPVDSEHSAIFQCLGFDRSAKFRKLILTASGGAFRDMPKERIKTAKAADALKHPNWLMGKKITIDCATMLNKGLEVIEACHLYNAPLEKVEAIIHPESIVHSLVEFEDGAMLAQLGYPSMKIPIQLALTYPERRPCDAPMMTLAGKDLTFREIDKDRFPCFSLALEAFKSGDNFPCAMNAANEAAVGLYLEDKIGFYDINAAIEYALSKTERHKVTEENLTYTDAAARRVVMEKFGV